MEEYPPFVPLTLQSTRNKVHITAMHDSIFSWTFEHRIRLQKQTMKSMY